MYNKVKGKGERITDSHGTSEEERSHPPPFQYNVQCWGREGKRPSMEPQRGMQQQPPHSPLETLKDHSAPPQVLANSLSIAPEACIERSIAKVITTATIRTALTVGLPNFAKAPFGIAMAFWCPCM